MSNSADVDAYIKMFPADVQVILQKIRKAVHHKVPDVAEKISYGIPCFSFRETYLIYIAGYKNHIGIYPLSAGTGQADLQEKLAPYLHGKGTAQFPLDKPIPYNLIDDIITARVQEVLRK